MSRRQSAKHQLREDAIPYRVGTADPPSKLRFIDLFCGIGGFRLAFERPGCECVFSSDWNEMAQITYEANFHERPQGDIYSVPDNDIKPHNISAAASPAGRSASRAFPRNSASAENTISRTRNGATFSSKWRT
jgi:hypothetical protein